MDVILLRKLSRKSIMGFGKYAELSVSELLIDKKSYLVWLYYNMEGISFIDEILDELHIRDDNRIDKPGINPSLHEKWIARGIANLNYKEDYHGTHFRKLMKKRGRADQVNKEKSRIISKGAMQRRNHGH